MRIDAHQHLWRYTPEEYGWIDDRMQVLRRNFLPSDLQKSMCEAGVQASIAVQARQTLEETQWLLGLASESTFIRGVVGWAPIAEAGFAAILEELRRSAHLRGLRHVVQAEHKAFLDGSAFNRGIDAMLESGLVYDILIYARQLEEATRFVDRHPRQSFVLDHLAKPDIAADGFASWRTAIQEIARRENVVCKLSGMVTEADWKLWTPAALEPYFQTVLEEFGPSRVMVGSDWPVLLVACGYAQWWQIVDGWLAPLSPSEQRQIRGGVAARVYGLVNDA